MGEVIDEDFHGEIRLPIHTGGEMIITSGVHEILWGISWCYSVLVLNKINGKLQQANLGRMTEGTDSSGM